MKGEDGVKKVYYAVSETNEDFINNVPPDGFDPEEVELYGTVEMVHEDYREEGLLYDGCQPELEGIVEDLGLDELMESIWIVKGPRGKKTDELVAEAIRRNGFEPVRFEYLK